MQVNADERLLDLLLSFSLDSALNNANVNRRSLLHNSRQLASFADESHCQSAPSREYCRRSMLNALKSASARWGTVLRPCRAWIIVGLTVLFVLGVRVRLREMPLERDEGEYAYAGQLILHGLAPYREAYTMKLPGTCAAYAAIMAVFGQTPSGIHFGVALVNAASIILIFLLGRKLLDDVAATAAAVSFALLSLSPWVLGLAGHATHFVALAALGGILVLLRVVEPKGKTAKEEGRIQNAETASLASFFILHSSFYLLFAGFLFGLAFLMKQHGLFFGVFGAIYLLRTKLAQKLRLSRLWRDLGLLALGCVVPYALTCLALWAAGALHPFFFWTITYARTYASAIPLVNGADMLRGALRAVVGPNLVLWVLPWVGALVMWWEERLSPRHRFFLMLLLFCSFASVSVGFIFREHYFIPLLPVLALLTGVAVSRGLFLLRHDTTVELFLALSILGLSVIALGASLIGNGSIWLGLSPVEAVRSIYASTLFPRAADVADLIRTNSAPGARVAVLGSEPEIYFDARRRAATGYLYMYPLVEHQAFALHMQQEMIAQIERARPDFVVYVDDDYSWLRQPEFEHLLFDWWPDYWAKNLDLVTTIDVEEDLDRGADPEIPSLRRSRAAPAAAPTTAHILVFKRRQP